MTLHIKEPRHATRATTECQQCGARIFVSSWSEAITDHRIRDLWECVACGYVFETEVVFPHAQAAA